jgi:colicin import membrane protein
MLYYLISVNNFIKEMKMEVLDAKAFQVAAYQPFYAQLQELEKSNNAIAFDYESAKGNKEARSHVYKLRQSKAALEKTRKDEKAESLRIGKAIDSEAKEIEARIEAMILVHQVKLDEIEKRETDRIDAIKTRLLALAEIHHECMAADYRYHLATLEQVKIDESWQEFAVEASQAKDQAIAKHRELLAAREKADAEAAELETLRKAAAEREQKDRDEKIAQEAAAKAMREAEAKQQQERDTAAKAIAEAEAKAKAEREAAERRELQLKLDAENAERRRLESEQKAKQDAQEAVEKAYRDQQAAIEAERKRVADEADKAAREQAKREADTKHKGAINRAALAAMTENGISEECAKLCIKLIASGKIPNIEINY